MEGEKFHYLVIGTDAYPIEGNNNSANERITVRGCMAHEVIGHYEAWKKGTTQNNMILEEAQASIRAAKFGIDLTDEERQDLMQDAMDRLQNNKIDYEKIKNKLDIFER